jgi:hypothetical protein
MGLACPLRALSLRNTISVHVFLVCYFSILAGISVFFLPLTVKKTKHFEYGYDCAVP